MDSCAPKAVTLGPQEIFIVLSSHISAHGEVGVGEGRPPQLRNGGRKPHPNSHSPHQGVPCPEEAMLRVQIGKGGSLSSSASRPLGTPQYGVTHTTFPFLEEKFIRSPGEPPKAHNLAWTNQKKEGPQDSRTSAQPCAVRHTGRVKAGRGKARFWGAGAEEGVAGSNVGSGYPHPLVLPDFSSTEYFPEPHLGKT